MAIPTMKLPDLTLEDAIRDAVTARENFSLEVLEAEFKEWDAVGADTPCEVHIRVALRGSINKLKDAYKPKGGSMKKLLSLILAAALAQGCASTGGVKKVGFVALTAAGQALWLAQGIEPTLVCDRVGAPPAPACVTPELHHTISLKFVEANKIGEQATSALTALPATVTGPTPEILNFISQIWGLLNEIRGLIPASAPQKKLASQLDELAANK